MSEPGNNDPAGRESLSYRDAGVDIDAGNALVNRIREVAGATRRPEVLTGLGGFASFCSIPAGYREPVLVSTTDGVGTKLRLAMDLGRHTGVGIDLVAMCVNDLVVTGAEPLFFLDYYATGRLDVDLAEAVIRGIGEGCSQAGCALVGGETAEMPGMYAGSDYDLAGFCTGVVERDAMLTGDAVAAGDQLVAIASSGPHSNGYSLVRRILEVSGADPEQALGDIPLADHLLAPTRIYVRPVLELVRDFPLHAAAHITGGGLLENLPRVIPDGLGAEVDAASWEWPPIFRWLQENGNVAEREMYRTFNCGIGMVLVVADGSAQAVIDQLASHGESAWACGRIVPAEGGSKDRLAILG